MFGIDLVVPDVGYLRSRREQAQGVRHHACPRGPCRRAALRAPRIPGRARLCLDARAWPARQQVQGAQAPRQPAAAARPGHDRRARPLRRSRRSGSATRSPTRWVSACGRRSGTSSTRATSSSTTRRSMGGPPTSRRWPDSARRACSSSCRTRPGPSRPATRPPSARSGRPSARSWRASTAGSSWRPSRPTSRASSRSSTPPRRSGARSRSSAGRWSRTRRIAAELGYLVAPETGLVAKDRLKDVAGRQAHHRDHGRPGRAHGGPGPHGQPRSSLRRDRPGRHRHRQRQPHPRQRGVRRAHRSTTSSSPERTSSTTPSGTRTCRATPARRS